MPKRRINELLFFEKLSKNEVDTRNLLKTTIVSAFVFFSIVSSIVALLVTMEVSSIESALPDTNTLKSYKPSSATKIYDVNKQLVATINGNEFRTNVPLNEMSPNLQNAVIAIEDNRFYSHQGIDIIGTFRAGKNNFAGSSVQGGSTLTQQLAKNAFLTQERSFVRKIAEAVLATKIEFLYPKKKILELYLNQIYWGNWSYGAEKAAENYFGKSAKDLNVAESAMLAGIIKAPEGLSPYKNLSQAKKRQFVVLEKMQKQGFISEKQLINALNYKLNFKKQEVYNPKYGYFVDYVRYLLEQKFGSETVRNGGLSVYTTLDPEIQTLAEKTISLGVASIPQRSNVREGALVSIKVDNGYVQAMVGGKDYRLSNYNRAVFSRRAAGSSFKPIVYLTAFMKGVITPDSMITDAPISFKTWNGYWHPHNWDGRYMGVMTVRKALSLSRNTTTIRVAMKIGVDSIIQTARLLGINTQLDHNLTIALGSAGVSPLQLANVYATFARKGVYIEPVVILSVKDSDDNVIYQDKRVAKSIIPSQYINQINTILVDVVDKGTAQAAKLDDRKVAGKTGTTDNVKDIWFNGYTPDTVTTIWLGNDLNIPMRGVFSSNCAELWSKFSKEYYRLKRIPPSDF